MLSSSLSSRLSVVACGVVLNALTCSAQFPPRPEGVTVLESKFGDGVRISYKEPGICETTPGVKSYAGYVHLPAGTLGDLNEEQPYPINTFFWFFEAREDPENAPLAVWMNGGPGSSSMRALLVENGPCFVNPDSNSTRLNEWSWNNEVNMLYLDQPVPVGFSYDTLQNITHDLVSDHITPLNDTDDIPAQNATFLVGTYPSLEANHTARGRLNGPRALWHFAQAWFQEFPAYHPRDGRISISTDSYGGRHGPAYATFFDAQNEKIENGTWADLDGDMYPLSLDTLVIVNGCIDRELQWPSYPHIAFNNTYGIQAVNATIHEQMSAAYHGEGGCRDRTSRCRTLSLAFDPDNRGTNASVNAVCEDAETFCTTYVRDPYLEHSGRNYHDFATYEPDPFPAPWYLGYLNRPHVQAALGVPLNFTSSSAALASGPRDTGGWREDLSTLLTRGVKVSLIYGDRDYACNWLAGEAVSVSLEWDAAPTFRSAGYTPIYATNETFVAGRVRQAGNLSFARVYQAGGAVPSYAPETAYAIFTRALFGRDIATGLVNTAISARYATVGPGDTWAYKNRDPPEPLWVCYARDLATCTGAQIEALKNGSAVLREWIVRDANSTLLYPEIFG